MNNEPYLLLLPEHESTSHSLFDSPEQFAEWVEAYRAMTEPIFKDLNRRRAESWREALHRGPHM